VQRFGHFLRKLRITILEMVQNKILRPIYKEPFFNILPHSFRILVQSFQKLPLGPRKKNILENYHSSNFAWSLDQARSAWSPKSSKTCLVILSETFLLIEL